MGKEKEEKRRVESKVVKSERENAFKADRAPLGAVFRLNKCCERDLESERKVRLC